MSEPTVQELAEQLRKAWAVKEKPFIEDPRDLPYVYTPECGTEEIYGPTAAEVKE